jgi:hypothetical protein
MLPQIKTEAQVEPGAGAAPAPRMWARLRTALLSAVVVVAVAALIMFGGPGSHAQAQTFTDVNEADRFYAAVEALAGQGVIGGHPDGSFRPYEPVTRAQFAFAMAALLHMTSTNSPVFTDVFPGEWFTGAVEALYEAGIVQGSADGSFGPDVELSRQQATTLIMRAYAYGPRGHAAAGAALLTQDDEIGLWLGGFRDRAAIAPIHRASVANALRLGVVSGFDDGRFYPFLNLTRAQAAGVLYAALVATPSVRPDPPVLVADEGAYPVVEKGSQGPLVGWIERRLAAISYQPGPIDGLFDERTAEAVMAFQKVEGLDRTGAAGAAVLSGLILAERPPVGRHGTGKRVEVDLSRQVLFLIADDIVEMTVPVASGREGWRTPTGGFSVERKLPYWRRSALGLLYKPVYFRGGYAIHGSYSVPPYPASHGCVRVSVSTMDVLYPLIPPGMRVDVYY